MSTVTVSCPNCGQPLAPGFSAYCAQCGVRQTPGAAAPETSRSWGAGAGLLAWVASVLLLLGWQLLAIVIYFIKAGQSPIPLEPTPGPLTIDRLFAVLTLALTFPAHLTTLLVCWLIVSWWGRQPFWEALGWSWPPRFGFWHAVGLALLMLGVLLIFAKVLPHQETEMERLLKLGPEVRVLTALLAVLTAPLVEEVVYRGVLYTGVERQWGWKAAVLLVTLLFALVHVPQYWGSYAALTTIMTLSLVLTFLRAWTGKLLPCVVTHLVFNGVQSIQLLVSGVAPEDAPSGAALLTLAHWLW